MKIDLHVHSGFSVCASTDYVEAVESYDAAGINFVLCNHYNALYTVSYGGAYTRADYPKRFVEEFYRTHDLGDRYGVKVFFGIEVALSLPDCPYAEFLIYGAQPQFLLDNPYIYELSQQELYKLCKKNDLMLVQAHPFRKEQGHFPHDLKCVDGVEINCHYRFLREEEKVKEIAKNNNLIITCGSDFHKKGQEGAGGIICRDVANEHELKTILLNNEFEIFMR
ncbi:MAG: PHP domain-containing protein [Clostridiales bacterium]|nr:PHP domain-containing protein [Clostridiales bacterium]